MFDEVLMVDAICYFMQERYERDQIWCPAVSWFEFEENVLRHGTCDEEACDTIEERWLVDELIRFSIEAFSEFTLETPEDIIESTMKKAAQWGPQVRTFLSENGRIKLH